MNLSTTIIKFTLICQKRQNKKTDFFTEIKRLWHKFLDFQNTLEYALK